MTKQTNRSNLEAEPERIERGWSRSLLLTKHGLFHLRDVAAILEISTFKVKAEADRLVRLGQSPMEAMGVIRRGRAWLVQMEVFSSYYLSHLVPRVQQLRDEWDANAMLAQKGVFFLRDVCQRIPFQNTQLRYQALKNPRAREEYGIWKDEDFDAYVVDMEKFAAWIASLWARVKR